jgi:hypothetical protein
MHGQYYILMAREGSSRFIQELNTEANVKKINLIKQKRIEDKDK